MKLLLTIAVFLLIAAGIFFAARQYHQCKHDGGIPKYLGSTGYECFSQDGRLIDP